MQTQTSEPAGQVLGWERCMHPFLWLFFLRAHLLGSHLTESVGHVLARRVLCVCLKAPDCGNKLNIAIDRSPVRSRTPFVSAPMTRVWLAVSVSSRAVLRQEWQRQG